jgi:glycosyltransferase involved in cell wall biosynthesis
VDLTVVIPAYNEAESIGSVLERLTTQMENVEGVGDFEILVVDDGSTDGTGDIARRIGGRVTVVRHPYNMGNGAGVKTGIRHARGRICLFMDADGQHSPELIGRILSRCDEYDMVVGARDGASHAGLHRRLANGLYDQLASYVTGRRVEDLTSGFRAIRRDVARRFVGLLPNGYSYPTTITLCLMRAGFSVLYEPITAPPRVGKSKIRLLADGSNFLMVIAKICMLFSPMKIFLPVSFYLFLMGLGYYGYTFHTEHRFTNMSMLLFSTSVIIFMMGLLAEQIAPMRLERTEYE